jgi:hypothetical protein
MRKFKVAKVKSQNDKRAVSGILTTYIAVAEVIFHPFHDRPTLTRIDKSTQITILGCTSQHAMPTAVHRLTHVV